MKIDDIRRILPQWLRRLAAARPASLPVPGRGGHVVDLAGVLTAVQRAQLEQTLYTLEQRQGCQFAVLLVPTTRPQQIEHYALRVARQWKLGRSRIDDGAILLVATGDRTARIEVGGGLQGALAGAASQRLLAEVLVPHFRRGDYFAGIDAASLQINALLKGAASPEPSGKPQILLTLARWLPGIVLAALLIGSMLRSEFGRLAEATVAGSLAGLSAGLLAGTLLLALGLVLGVSILAMLGIVWFGQPAALLGGRRCASGMRGGGGSFGGCGSSARW